MTRGPSGTNGYIKGLKGIKGHKDGSALDILDFRPVATEWKLQGNCADPGLDPGLFFLDGYGPGRTSYARIQAEEAVAVCHRNGGCPVMKQCLEYHDDSERAWIVCGGQMPTFKPKTPKTKSIDGVVINRGGVEKKRHCSKGHDSFAPDGRTTDGRCRICVRARQRALWHKKKGGAMVESDHAHTSA